MKRILTRSNWLKAWALLVCVVAFVFAWQTKILDSPYAAIEKIFSDPTAPTPGARLRFAATAYCKGTTTTSGVAVRTGIAAADASLLPVGSVINIAAGNPKYSGVYTVMDTGPAVRGRELDLYIWSCNEALQFGRRNVEITVLRLGWDPQASSPSIVQRLFKRREAARKIPPPEPPPPAGVPPEKETGNGNQESANP
jgi:3D (Asp-Asp-Asp) domain-containing protein